MQTTFTAVYQKRGEWYIGYVKELPGANVQERTLDEARNSLKEAVMLIIETNRDLYTIEPNDDSFVTEELQVEV